jgi:hypothetical protein
MISGASETSYYARGRARSVATGPHVKRIHIAGKINLPIAGGNIDPRNCPGYRNHPHRGAGCDRKLGTRIHENSLRFDFFSRSRPTPHGVG